MQAFLVPV
jgi:hypothetical protein